MKDAALNFWIAGATVVCIMAGATLAYGHGDAAWIMNNPAYTDKDNANIHCCGPSDCHAAVEGAVVPVSGGYLVKETGEVIPANKTYYTEPDKLDIAEYWYCLRNTDPKRVRCLFVPGGAS